MRSSHLRRKKKGAPLETTAAARNRFAAENAAQRAAKSQTVVSPRHGGGCATC